MNKSYAFDTATGPPIGRCLIDDDCVLDLYVCLNLCVLVPGESACRLSLALFFPDHISE